MNILLTLLQEKGGSTMRLVTAWTFFIVLSVWAAGNIMAMRGPGAHELLALPPNIMELLLGVALGKVAQKFVENRKPGEPAPDEVTPPVKP